MATRRKYKTAPPAVADVAAAPAPAPPIAPEPTAGAGDASPLQRALQAQAHAEHLQRQHATRAQIGLPEPPLDPATRQAVEAHIDNMPNLSDHKRRFLKSHPSLLQQPYLHLMQHAYQLALHAGVRDDSVEMDHAVLSGIHLNMQHHRQLTSASARPTPENHQAHQDATEAAAELQREAEMHLAAHQQPAANAAPSPHRRSMPMQAPVSRDSPSASGHRQPDGWNTLTREEREIARNSFGDPNMSNAEKELLYLRNKQKYSKMKADGSYREQRG